jgi:hypothetical protein
MSSGRLSTVRQVQGELFDDAADGRDDHLDPYDELRADAARLGEQYAISAEAAFELMVAYGSRTAALRHLRQSWWLGDVQLREPPLAA